MTLSPPAWVNWDRKEGRQQRESAQSTTQVAEQSTSVNTGSQPVVLLSGPKSNQEPGPQEAELMELGDFY